MYSLRNYGDMILDAGRTGPYVEALRRAVRPGSVVLDIGTGTGLFAMLACRFGARRVFALEPGDAIGLAREIAAANDLDDRIEFMQALSTDVTLPEKADVIVAEIHGILPLFQRYIPTIVDARRRHLAPQGTIIPARETLWVGVVEAPAVYEPLVAPWAPDTLGIDMTAGRGYVTNDLARAEFEPGQLISHSACAVTLDYGRIERADVEFTVSLKAARDATAHGLALWFDAQLAPGIELSNAPGKPRLIFGNAFMPWPEPVAMHEGDAVEARVSAKLVGERYLWSWDSSVDRGGGAKLSFRQSQFFAAPLEKARLRRQAADTVVRLGEEGEIERMILDRMKEGRNLGEIARELSERYPRRYGALSDALPRVADVSLRYGL